MKKIILITLVSVFLSSCATQKSGFELKTLDTNDFTISYPNTWIRFGYLDYVYLAPKNFKKEKLNLELNNLSINYKTINTHKFDDIESALISRSKDSKYYEKNKTSRLIKLDNNSKFIYKIESDFKSSFETKSLDINYKRVEYFYVNSGSLEYVSFQAREKFFDSNINGAMIIINSLNPKKKKPTVIKSYSTENYTINYPENWVKFDKNEQVYFAPKESKNLDNTVSVLTFKALKNLNIDDFVKQHIADIEKTYANLTSDIKKVTSDYGDANFVQLLKRSNGQAWRVLSTYYKINDVIYLIEYTAKEEIFSLHLLDARFILDSIRFKK